MNVKKRPPRASASVNCGTPATKLFNWVKALCEFGPPETICRVIGFRLALYMVNDGKENIAWPSHSSIARDCGKSRRHTIGGVNRLISLGWLNKRQTRSLNGRKWPHNVYRLAFPPGIKESDFDPAGAESW